MYQSDGATHVIEGRDDLHSQQPEGDSSFLVKEADLKYLFKKFVKEFTYQAPGTASANITTFKYREEFQQSCSAGIFALEVNLGDLVGHEDWEKIGHCLRERPTDYVPVCEKALLELYVEVVKRENDGLPEKDRVPYIQLVLKSDADLDRSKTFGIVKPLKVRDLTSAEVERLVILQGIIISQRTARKKARRVTLRCKTCENVKEIHVKAGFCAAHIPAACDGVGREANEKCPTNPFVIVEDRCDYVDEQILKLQELPEDVPVGEMPRNYDLSVMQYSVDTCKPGTRVNVVGVFCATEHSAGTKVSAKPAAGAQTIKYSYVQVLSIEAGQGMHTKLTQEEEERFQAMSKDPRIREKIYSSIAPSICASEKDKIDDIKKALASLLFSGTEKRLPDGTRLRGDINILLLGDPGVAKSQFLKFAEKASPICVYTSGKGSSAAGLTAAVVNDANGFSLEGGAMVLADQGVVCIDEFDKMDNNDRVAIHEAMEQQTISISKAGINTMLNTRCSVLAAANPRMGSYQENTSTAEQIDFESTILSRFDMLFLVKDVRDEDRDFDLACHMTSLHMGELVEEREGPLKISDLKKYIQYCKTHCKPRMSPDVQEVAKNYYIKTRQQMKGEAITMTVRHMEAIMRISESIAKMELREDITQGDVEEAIELFRKSTLDSSNADRLNPFHANEEERHELEKAQEQVRRLIPKGGRKTKAWLTASVVSAAAVDEKTAGKAIIMMIRSAELEEKPNLTVQRVR